MVLSLEMLEYNMQQKQSQILEMQVELRGVKDRAAELQEQLNSERMMGAELKNELAQAKLELETTLKAQHKHFRDLETIRCGFQCQTFCVDSEDISSVVLNHNTDFIKEVDFMKCKSFSVFLENISEKNRLLFCLTKNVIL